MERSKTSWNFASNVFIKTLVVRASRRTRADRSRIYFISGRAKVIRRINMDVYKGVFSFYYLRTLFNIILEIRKNLKDRN